MNKITLLAIILFSAQSFAALPKALKCDNGHLEDDRSFQVVITKAGIELRFWESVLIAKRTDLVVSGNTIAIVDKTLHGSAEGDDYAEKTSALFVYDAKTKQLVTTLHLGGFVSRSAQKLKCR